MAGPDRDELIRLIKGTPQPEVSTQSMAERMGASESETAALIEQLVSEGRLQREGDRLIVVEPAASQAPPDVPIP
ncbi:MAG: hypothetical protein M3P40_10980 [Actinomycetota bacterium]|nr:hypothetical protein [Actinomycetota bacterium]